MPGPVFEMPASPLGWEGSSAQLVRIIDPLGDAIAWFAPERGGCCVGLAVRQAALPTEARASSWRDIVVGSAANPYFATTENGDSTTGSPWRFVERDPASCKLGWWSKGESPAQHWEVTAFLADARLSLFLRFQNTGTTPVRTGVGLRLVLSSLPDAIHRKAGQASGDAPAISRDTMNASQDQHDRIVLVVESELGTSTVRTEQAGNEIDCTITDHHVQEHPPIVEPGRSRCLSVQIGFWETQSDHV